jgi:hypothetical protein
MAYPCAKGRVGGTGLDEGPGKSIETCILKLPLSDGKKSLNFPLKVVYSKTLKHSQSK